MSVEKPASRQWAFCSWAITWYKISSLESKWRTRTCWTKKIQIWWLCLSCPRASFALECEDFVPRVSVKRQHKFPHLRLWRHRMSAPVNLSFSALNENHSYQPRKGHSAHFVQRDQRWIIAKLLTCRKVLFWRDVLVCRCRCRSS